MSRFPLGNVLCNEPKNISIKYDKYMCLQIYVKEDNKLKEKYLEYAETHNKKIMQNDEYIDSGFDIFTPCIIVPTLDKVNRFDFNIVCSATMMDNFKQTNTGYYMYPRSSLSKTRLRLANSVGIIDSGYRGNLIGMFDCLKYETTDKIEDNKSNIEVNQYDRLVQICAPGLVPIYVTIVDTFEELGDKTMRGDGCFGSTGR